MRAWSLSSDSCLTRIASVNKAWMFLVTQVSSTSIDHPVGRLSHDNGVDLLSNVATAAVADVVVEDEDVEDSDDDALEVDELDPDTVTGTGFGRRPNQLRGFQLDMLTAPRVRTLTVFTRDLGFGKSSRLQSGKMLWLQAL